MNSLLMLMILCGGLHLNLGEKLQCQYKDKTFYLAAPRYYCFVTSLDISFNNMAIDGYTGTHIRKKNDIDVKGIYIQSTNTKYIPANLGYFFKLTALLIWGSQLVEIKSEDFQGMDDLTYLSLDSNKLTYLSSDSLSTLTKLKFISMASNQLKYIGPGVFDKLVNLNFVYLIHNVCVRNNYHGIPRVSQMKKDLAANCENEILTTTTTTHNPMENRLKNVFSEEIKKEKQNKENEINKLRDDLQKKELENTKVTKERDEIKIKYDSLMNDKETLVEEKETLMKDIKEKDENLKVINEVKKERDHLKKQLIDLKIELHNERAVSEELRTKLINSNEQLAKCTEVQREQTNSEVTILDLTNKLLNCEVNQKNLTENKCNSFNIHCEFLDTNGVYSCMTQDLIINQKDMELITVSGTHLESNSNEDVTELLIVNTALSYWSNDIQKSFPALKTLRIQNAKLKELTKGDFDSAFNLTVIVVNGNDIKSLGDEVFHGTEERLTGIDLNSNKIEKLSSGTFHGLNQLKVLSLKDNSITELPLGLFKDVVMLEILILTGNKIKFLHGKLLESNTRLITFAVDHNELREIGEDILDYSVMLNDVHLEYNDCIDEGTNEQTTIYERTRNDLIFVITNCCKNPTEALNVYNCGHKGWEYLSLKDNLL